MLACYILVRRSLKEEQCKASTKENHVFCTFHDSIYAHNTDDKRVDKWLHCIRPKPEHAHLKFYELPKEEYSQYPQYLS
ncbi:Hypothetical protein HVR_LOCUS829 [uncultured virus]|nr:Hypothetical protein HVR_LOCUS829 [uncultured virus]